MLCVIIMLSNSSKKETQTRLCFQITFVMQAHIWPTTKTLQEPQDNSTYSALPVGRVGVDVSDGKRTGSGRLTSSSKSPASVSGIMSGSAPE